MTVHRRVAWHAVGTSSVLHLLAVWGLLHYYTSGKPGVPHDLVPFVVRLTSPSEEMSPQRLTMPETRPGRRERKQIDRSHAIAQARTAEEEKTVEEPVALTSSSPGVEAMIEAAKRNVGNIDRELRQAFPSRGLVPAQPSSSPLERGIASAGLSRGTTMQELVLDNGRRITKVITPSGTYCVLGRKPGAGITENELAALTTTNCPN